MIVRRTRIRATEPVTDDAGEWQLSKFWYGESITTHRVSLIEDTDFMNERFHIMGRYHSWRSYLPDVDSYIIFPKFSTYNRVETDDIGILFTAVGTFCLDDSEFKTNALMHLIDHPVDRVKELESSLFRTNDVHPRIEDDPRLRDLNRRIEDAVRMREPPTHIEFLVRHRDERVLYLSRERVVFPGSGGGGTGSVYQQQYDPVTIHSLDGSHSHRRPQRS